MGRLTKERKHGLINAMVKTVFAKRIKELDDQAQEIGNTLYDLITCEFDLQANKKILNYFAEKRDSISVNNREKENTWIKLNTQSYYYRAENFKYPPGYFYQSFSFPFGEQKWMPRLYANSSITLRDNVIPDSLWRTIQKWYEKNISMHEDRDKLITESIAILTAITTEAKLAEEYPTLYSYLPKKEEPKKLPIKNNDAIKGLIACSKKATCTGEE